MKTIFAALAAFALAAPVMATAATVSVNYTSYNQSGVGTALAARDTFIGSTSIGEDFENFTACTGTNVDVCASGTINTALGSFRGIDPAISNGLSQVAPKDKIVVRSNVPNNNYGRYNVTPGGKNWLDSNDMAGILWNFTSAVSFTKVAFLLTDLDDVGSMVFRIKVGDNLEVLRPASAPGGDKKLHLVTVLFHAPVTSFTMRMVNGTGDGFGFDGARVAAVPVPAAGILMLGALGGLAALKRRRKTA